MIRVLEGLYCRVRERRALLEGDFLKNNDRLGLEFIDPQDLAFQDLANRLVSSAMFASRRLIVLTNPSVNPSMAKELPSIFSQLDEQTELVITEVDPQKPPELKSYFKALTQQNHEQLKALVGQDLVTWLLDQAKPSKLEPKDARYFINYLDGDQDLLAKEVEKLKVYEKIDSDLIERLVVRPHQSKIFDLLDAVVKMDWPKALEIYEDQRQQKVEPIVILATIIWQVRLLVAVKLCQKSPDALASSLGVNPYPLKKLGSLGHLRVEQLQNLVDLCLQTNRRLTINFSPPDATLKFFIIKSCRVLSAS